MLGFVFLVILCIAFCDAQAGGSPATLVRQDLNAAEWETSNQNGTISFVAGQLPVYVLEALYASGQVTQGDPISGYNDRNYRWVAEDVWIFQAEINTSQIVLGQQQVDLVLYGVDTVADVYLNDQLLGSLNNAFREYRLPVKQHLVEGINMLALVFSPSPHYAKLKAAEYPIGVPMQAYMRGFDHYNFIRKPASDFGWDWGPAFAPSGVYGYISLEAYSLAYLTGASIRQEHQESGQVDVYFDAVLQAAAAGESGTLTVSADEEDWSNAADVELKAAGENVVTVKVSITDNYSLWWPVGFGQPVLYNFTLTYAPSTNGTGQQAESCLSRRLGIRTIELVEQPLRDPAGFSFYFRVNGVPVYARGANMIPLQIFHSQNSEAGYQQIVGDAVAANMNMLRIWGGGLYQADSFYDVADEMGVLVWQEAMFACAQYPRNEAFLSNVAAEVAHQARRLGHHASLAIWGGNNEVETSFTWFPESSANQNLFSVDYSVLFVETVRQAILSVLPGVNFVDSSPSKGVFSLNPYIKRWGNPSDVYAGDVHFYDYASNCVDPAIYPRARFVSEFGFQSYPSFFVYKRYTQAKDWSIQSNMSDYRQRHPDGNAELQSQMQFHFQPIAANATNESLQVQLFKEWIYLTQVQQSMCYETAITNWRRLKAAPDVHTMGVLYWQLNDIWAGPSWSGIDYGGHWKLLMYGVRRYFSPVLVSGTYNISQADALSVYVTNDQPWRVSGTVTVELIAWGARSYEQPLVTVPVEFSVGALGSSLVATVPIKSQLANSSLTLMDAVVRLSATACGDPGELLAQTCTVDGEDPFSSICTPAKGVSPPAPPSEGTQPGAAVQAPYSPSPGPCLQQPLNGGLQSYESSQVVWLTDPKAAAIPLKPRVKVRHVRQLGSALASFKVTSRGVAAFVQFDSDQVEGIFSDNGILVLPWEAKTITFTGRAAFAAADLQKSLSIMTFADTLSGGGMTEH